MIKESEMDELVVSVNGLRIAQLLACHPAELLVQNKAAANQTVDLTALNEAVKMTKKEKIDAFSSKIIYGHTKTLLLGNNMQVMTQSLKGGDGLHLPHSLRVVNTYTEVTSGNKWVAQVVATNAVPKVEVAPRTLEKIDEVQVIQ